MRIPLLISILLVIVALPCEAKKIAHIFGGNCNNSSFFGGGNLASSMRRDILNSASLLEKRGWQINLNYSQGKGALTNELVGLPQEKMPIENWKITEGSKEQFIDTLHNVARTLKKGDQYFLQIVTHGAPANPPKQAHGICLSNGTVLRLDDPEFLKALGALKSSGADLAFINNACFGGAAQEIFAPLGCFLASQTAEFPALATNPKDSKIDELPVQSGSDIEGGRNFGGIITTLNKSLYRTKVSEPIDLENIYLKSVLNNSFHLKGPVFPVMGGSESSNSLAASSAILCFQNNAEMYAKVRAKLPDSTENQTTEAQRNFEKLSKELYCFELNQNLPLLRAEVASLEKVANLIQGDPLIEIQKKVSDLADSAENRDLNFKSQIVNTKQILDKMGDLQNRINELESSIEKSLNRVDQLTQRTESLGTGLIVVLDLSQLSLKERTTFAAHSQPECMAQGLQLRCQLEASYWISTFDLQLLPDKLSKATQILVDQSDSSAATRDRFSSIIEDAFRDQLIQSIENSKDPIVQELGELLALKKMGFSKDGKIYSNKVELSKSTASLSKLSAEMATRLNTLRVYNSLIQQKGSQSNSRCAQFKL